ncbi:MAG TPA: signal peptidase I, partial [Candidatus Pelethocola excrementipullorum]|nr:signal peptidase I [Candidatus Pelethocola excrementipullorum]
MVKKVCGLLNKIIMLCLALVAILLLVPTALGYKSMAVISGSMEPDIPVGAVVIVKEVMPKTLKTGDVITYQISEGTMVTHRINRIDKDKEEIVTKGDANDVADANPVTYDRVVGKMAACIPLLGYISIYIKTPLGIAVVCGIVCVLIL